MENYIQAEDYELWMLIKNGPLIPTKVNKDGTKIHKKPEEFNADDYKRRMPKPKNSCILVLGQMSILTSLSASQPRTYGMLSKWLMKERIR